MILDRQLFALIKTKDLQLNYKIETIDFRTREIGILDLNGELAYHSFDDILQIFEGNIEKTENIKLEVINGGSK